MAENAPYMQAIGWSQDDNGNYIQNPRSQGAMELSKSLFDTGVNAATDVFLGPLVERALVSGYKALKPVIKSKFLKKSDASIVHQLYTPEEQAAVLSEINVP